MKMGNRYCHLTIWFELLLNRNYFTLLEGGDRSQDVYLYSGMPGAIEDLQLCSG